MVSHSSETLGGPHAYARGGGIDGIRVQYRSGDGVLPPQAGGRGELIPPWPQDSASYFDQPTDMVATGLWRLVANTLSAIGIEAEAMHHEVANGQHEVDLRYADALKTADSAVAFRVVLKILAQQKGLYARSCPSRCVVSVGAACTYIRD